MKQIYSTFFFTLFSIMTFSQTFDWETAVDNGNNIVQTVSSITATFTASNDIVTLINGGGFAGSSGNVAFVDYPGAASATVSFSTPIDLLTLYAFNADDNVGATWTFTPTGGSNSNVVQYISATTGSTVTLNWTNITSFTITSTIPNEYFGLDNIKLGSTLSVENFSIKSKILVYPNPSSDFIYIQGLSEMENYRIYNNLGVEVISGVISREDKIDIQNLTNGIYFLKFANGNTSKFIKE